MKEFLVKVGYYLMLVLALSLILLVIIYLHPNWVDKYYLKVTTPKATSLILGTSRASQGIIPQIINEKVGKTFDGYIVNHGFTMGLTPFGPSYERFMKQKIVEGTTNGIYILEVSPSGFCAQTTFLNDTSRFMEREGFIGKITNSSTNPNIQYLTKFYSERHFIFEYLYSEILNKDRVILDNNMYGSMNVIVKADTANLNFRLKRRINYYLKEYNGYSFSQARFDAFERMVKYLQERGEVYLVRLPVSDIMMKEEYRMFPDFDERIEVFATKNNLHYFNYISYSKNYITTDGSHLYRPSAELLTTQLCDSLLKYRAKEN